MNKNNELLTFLDNQFIGNLATSDGDSLNLVTIFYVRYNKCLFFKSRTTSVHSLHVEKNKKIVFTAYSHDSNYSDKYGVQIKGSATRITDHETMKMAVNLYSERFDGAGAKLPSIEELCSPEIKSTFYKLEIDSFKIIDEEKTRGIDRTMSGYETI